MRWYERAARDVPARATWDVPIRRMLDSLQTAEDLAGLRLAYVDAGPTGSAFARTGAGAVERRIEDAAFGRRWLEIAQAGRFDLNTSLARQLPLERLNDSGAAPTDSRRGHGAD